MGENKNMKRVKYTGAFILFLIIEVLIALYVNDSFVRPYVGDMLVVIVLYYGVRIIIPDKFKLLPLWIFIFAAFVEVLQYFNIVRALGLENNRFLSVLLGSVFDWKDILCYGVGTIIILFINYIDILKKDKIV